MLICLYNRGVTTLCTIAKYKRNINYFSLNPVSLSSFSVVDKLYFVFDIHDIGLESFTIQCARLNLVSICVYRV